MLGKIIDKFSYLYPEFAHRTVHVVHVNSTTALIRFNRIEIVIPLSHLEIYVGK